MGTVVSFPEKRKESAKDRALKTDPHVILTFHAWHLVDRTWWVEQEMTSRMGEPQPAAFDVIGQRCERYGRQLQQCALGRRGARRRRRTRRAKTGRR